jgi:hypothetical protein
VSWNAPVERPREAVLFVSDLPRYQRDEPRRNPPIHRDDIPSPTWPTAIISNRREGSPESRNGRQNAG